MTIARVLLAIVLAGFGLAVWGIHRDIESLSSGMASVGTAVGQQLGNIHSKLSSATDKLDKTYNLTHGIATIHHAKTPSPVKHLLPQALAPAQPRHPPVHHRPQRRAIPVQQPAPVLVPDFNPFTR